LAGFSNQAAMAIANSRLLETTEGELQQLSAILEAIPEGIIVVDSESYLQYANPTAEDLLGLPLRPFGRPVAETIPLPDLVRFLANPAVHPRGLDLAGAGERQLQVAVRGVQSAEDGGLWQVCVLQDVTRLRQLDELKSEFVHTVSHDLRRPLTMIEGQVHMIEMLGPLNTAQQDYARRIRLSAQNMNRLVKDLLDFGRVESGVEIRRALVRIAEVVQNAVEELRSEAAAENVRLTVELPETLPEISADSSLLERALGNLLDNAIRFNRPGGSVLLSAGAVKDSLVISVKDTGIGIAPADQPRIFEKFYRAAPRDDPEHPAWGLGLAIVKSVAERHGGRVWFESRLGQGSTFYLGLPLKS
jgi:signal transduction histidine kinase